MTIVSIILALFALGIIIVPGISTGITQYRMAKKRAEEDREIAWGK